jgi:hypothetical protein
MIVKRILISELPFNIATSRKDLGMLVNELNIKKNPIGRI